MVMNEMDKVKLKYDESLVMSPLEMLEEVVKVENEREGNLNLNDGYNCPICKNKGYIAMADKERMVQVDKRCECMNVRKSLISLKNSGLNYESIRKLSSKDFIATESWQREMLNKVTEFIKSYEEKNWLYFGGQSGAGKTLLMTILFKFIVLKYHCVGYYLMWNAESKILVKQVYRDPVAYNNRVQELIDCDLLYIDDFLKLGNTYTNEELSLAYEIINNRYIKNKVTLFTSELALNELSEKDGAIFGRIFEKTQKGRFILELIGKEKNYRMKK